jgi:hypothetical protein
VSAPVDVLAVMDAIDGWAREVSDEFIDGSDFRAEYARDLRDFREARSAVAELIDVGHSALAALAENGEWPNTTDALRAALARVGAA